MVVLTKIKKWISSHRKLSLIIAGVFLIVATAGGAYAYYQATAPEQIALKLQPVKKAPPQKYYSPLTGIEVKDEAATKQLVTAIMIENSPEARPQSGLKEAGIVYEAVAEGGITRFLALYQESKPQLIGPVRSLRMYYLDWAASYDASIAHIGGSANALSEVRNGNYRDIDQFFNAEAYWRATDRYAPHNVYTSFEKLDALNGSKGFSESNFTGFERTDEKQKTAAATSVSINFSGALFNTSYSYDSASDSYLRSIGGASHDDRESGRISPKNVVALEMTMTKVMEDGWREHIETSGNGAAKIFQNGTVIEGTWKKDGRKEPLQLLDTSGKPIKLQRGQTWVAAVPINDGGSVSWQ